jgi:hypothetical protein
MVGVIEVAAAVRLGANFGLDDGAALMGEDPKGFRVRLGSLGRGAVCTAVQDSVLEKHAKARYVESKPPINSKYCRLVQLQDFEVTSQPCV